MNIKQLVRITLFRHIRFISIVAGFVFDWGDQFGEEPYGYVGDFYFEYKEILDSIKSKYPDIEIEGHIFMTELGSWDCVYRESVNTTPRMKKIKYTRQLQCVKCRHWRDPKEAHTILSEEGYEEYMEENDLYGSSVLPQGLDGRGWYCICC